MISMLLNQREIFLYFFVPKLAKGLAWPQFYHNTYTTPDSVTLMVISFKSSTKRQNVGSGTISIAELVKN